jgi:hypothetical protein
LNLDGQLSMADAVLIMNSIFMGEAPPAGEPACDLNCDGLQSAADAVWLLYATMFGRPFPC